MTFFAGSAMAHPKREFNSSQREVLSCLWVGYGWGPALCAAWFHSIDSINFITQSLLHHCLHACGHNVFFKISWLKAREMEWRWRNAMNEEKEVKFSCAEGWAPAITHPKTTQHFSLRRIELLCLSSWRSQHHLLHWTNQRHLISSNYALFNLIHQSIHQSFHQFH